MGVPFEQHLLRYFHLSHSVASSIVRCGLSPLCKSAPATVVAGLPPHASRNHQTIRITTDAKSSSSQEQRKQALLQNYDKFGLQYQS
jgi:hypothetical protein